MAGLPPSNPPFDPMALWRDAVTQWEKGVNDVVGKSLGTSEFAQGMHGAMGTSLSAQKTFADLTARYLTAVNLPSRADVVALGERMSAIEVRLIRMNTLLEHLVDPVAAAGSTTAIATTTVAKVPRTKRPPSLPEPVVATPRGGRRGRA